jgi:hypothetical protein
MAVKNISALNTQVDILLPDNNQQLISPADVRNAIKDLNDSAVNRLSDISIFGLKPYDSSRSYQAGDGVFYNGVLYQAIQTTTGSFTPADWEARSSDSGTWGSIAGTISSQTDLQNALDAKQALLSANTPLFKSGNVLTIQQANAGQNGFLSSSDWTTFNSKENVLNIVSPLTRTGNQIGIQYVSETQDGVLSSANWIALTSNGFSDISYGDLLAAISGQLLIKGNYYKILAGTRSNEGAGTSGDLILLAINNNTLASMGYLLTTLPLYENIGSGIVGIWTADSTPNASDKFIYNGKVYNNLTGAGSTSPDIDGTNWELVADPTFYKTELDSVEYDVLNNWISFRADNRGNRYLYASQTSNGLLNGIDSFQWGNDLVFGNSIDNGVLNNINNPVAVKLINLNKSGIYQSLATSDIRTYTFRDQDGTVAFLSDLGDSAMVSTTHADLLAAIAGGTLVAGAHYVISDFQTVHVIPETTSVNTGTVETLICVAASTNKLYSTVLSPLFPSDTIIYDVSDVLAEDGTTARKGKITYRKDNVKNLETWYDFRAVKFRRWMIDGTGMATWAFSTVYTKGQVVLYAGNIYKALASHTSGVDFNTDLNNYNWAPFYVTSSDYVAWTAVITDFGDSIHANPASFQDILTFADGNSNISIAKNTSQPYNNIVFPNVAGANVFDLDCKNMTVFNTANFNTVGKGCSGIIIYNGSNSNRIGDNCSGIIISNGSAFNTMGASSFQIFLYGASYNTIDRSCDNLFINGSCSSNKFGHYASYNFLTGGSAENIIGVASQGNVFSGNVRGNIIGSSAANSSGASNNIIINSAYSNTLADACNGNLFTNNANNNSLLNNSSQNTFTNSSSNNILDRDCSNNYFENSYHNKTGSGSWNNNFNSASSNSIGQSSSNNTFSSNCNGNFIGNRSDYNAFGNNSIGNRIGNFCVSNQILPSFGYYYGVSGQYNVFENYCSNNVINGNYNRLESYCHFIQCTSLVYLSNCFFCSGLQNISFNGTFIIDNLRVLLSKDFSSLLTISSATAPKYNNIVVDMKDSNGVLWYKFISVIGKISTKKFV